MWLSAENLTPLMVNLIGQLNWAELTAFSA
jgi:hypothetical protein